MAKNIIIVVLVLLLALALFANIKLSSEIKPNSKEERDEHRRWIRGFTEENRAWFKDYEHRLERFRDILRRHRIKWQEEPGAVLEIAPNIGVAPE